MSTSGNDQGRAYEYAWIQTLYETLHHVRKTKIAENSSLRANERAWEALEPHMQDIFLLSTNSAIDTLIELEPCMIENNEDDLFLTFQQDYAGITGDVRDIVISRKDINWEIGLSIKHNHEAVKHSRLSHKLDFGKEWFDIPCSDQYWDAVSPVFDYLKNEKKKKTDWSSIPNKEENIYVPLLQAFMAEVQRANISNDTIPQKMIEYLIGTDDYYKIVSHDKKRLTMIHTFNLHNTLNKQSKATVSDPNVSVIKVPVVKLPTELVALKFKTNSKTTVEMYLNNGWQLSFRIHSASTKVEPSLKFDIQFIGMPTSILNIECKWS